MYKYAGIIINNDSIALDKMFTYKIPQKLQNEISLGCRVYIPFGKGNRKIDGFVLDLFDNYNAEIGSLKEIISLCDDFPLLKESDIHLIKIMTRKYLCTFLDCIKVMIPSGISKGIKKKYKNVILVQNVPTGKFLKEPYINIYNIINSNNGVYNKNELFDKFHISVSSLNTMIKYKYLSVQKVSVGRFDKRDFNFYRENKLNTAQLYVYNEIINSKENIYLIHGITGSGKTEIYMQLVSYFMKLNKESLILVPEISLTPQMVERFKGRFGSNIAVFHSKLSDGERFDEWMRVKLGEVKVAIGARSAVFLPFNNLGLIVIDEEHEGSYKSDNNPKYNAKEIAEIRCEYEGCKLILGSATPSVETYYRASNSKIKLLEIKNRADGAELPKVDVVDMRDELIKNNKSIFSGKLYYELRECLNRGEQAILFLNRRGFSTFVSCRKCGYVFKCNHCDISLTYHSEDSTLECHYCGAKQKVPNICPKCGSKYVKYFGIGTEKVEQEIKKYIKDVRTIRMDYDSTRGKDSIETIYNIFKEKKADILIGTQMVAKGLDFKNVTLVGVICADLSLGLPDYRSEERTFQILTQVSGRAGRGEKPGTVIIQTYNPKENSIQYSSNNNYKDFYNNEILFRKAMNYPPFSKIMCINMKSYYENKLIDTIKSLGVVLKNKYQNNDQLELLGPCSCSISKIKEFYRWQIIIKGNITTEIANDIKDKVFELTKNCYEDLKVSIDINPSNML